MELFGQYKQFFVGLFIGTFLDTKTVIILSILMLVIKNPEMVTFNSNTAPQDVVYSVWMKVKDIFVNR